MQGSATRSTSPRPANAGPHALVIGEALVDVIDGRAFPGGSPLNVAVGLSRLGVPTTLAARLGDDEHGRLIADHLRASQVDFSSPEPGAVTSSAEVRLDDAGHASYDFRLDSTLPEATLTDISLVHTGSLGAVLAPGAAEVARAFADPGIRLRSYDPNIRPQLMQDHAATLLAVELLAGRSHIVKLSDEDAAWLYPGSSADWVLAHLLELGAALTVLTRGENGSLARAGEHSIVVPANRVAVVDTVGAGDSFMSGLLAATLTSPLAATLLAGETPSAQQIGSALEFATHAAGITASRAGANPPWTSELADTLSATS